MQVYINSSLHGTVSQLLEEGEVKLADKLRSGGLICSCRPWHSGNGTLVLLHAQSVVKGKKLTVCFLVFRSDVEWFAFVLYGSVSSILLNANPNPAFFPPYRSGYSLFLNADQDPRLSKLRQKINKVFFSLPDYLNFRTSDNSYSRINKKRKNVGMKFFKLIRIQAKFFKLIRIQAKFFKLTSCAGICSNVSLRYLENWWKWKIPYSCSVWKRCRRLEQNFVK